MAETLSDLAAPDDSGRDAFTRYRFQAHVAFPACLDCATEQRVVAVTCEHFEDLLIAESDVLRFTQIKTRNADYGPWRFSDLCRTRGGALVSLLRTHRALSPIREERRIVYEVRLEGVGDRRNEIARLTVGGDGADDGMARTLAKALRESTELTLAEARGVLARVIVRFASPRESIEAENLQKLRAVAGHLPANELKAVYDRAIELVCKAMEGKLLEDEWPAVLFEPDTESEERAALIAGKRLDAERLRPIFEPLFGDDPLKITRLADEGAPDTSLTRKMRSAGASDQLIDRARTLRAAATRREIEVRGRDLTGNAEADFADVDERLLTAAVAAAEAIGDTHESAGAVFAAVLDKLTASPAQYDPRSLFAQDGLALLGAVCQLSDECLFGWRRDA